MAPQPQQQHKREEEEEQQERKQEEGERGRAGLWPRQGTPSAPSAAAGFHGSGSRNTLMPSWRSSKPQRGSHCSRSNIIISNIISSITIISSGSSRYPGQRGEGNGAPESQEAASPSAAAGAKEYRRPPQVLLGPLFCLLSPSVDRRTDDACGFGAGEGKGHRAAAGDVAAR